jgi:predicted enzyme related to lactoylglutathione lyase
MQAIQSQITFLYYQDIESIADFYKQVMGFELVEDQKWAKIYRVGGNAYVGIVAGDKGFHKPQPQSAVLVTLVVNDVPGWYAHLQEHGVTLLSDLEHKEDIQVRCFFFKDPGGYTYEIQEFLKPELAEIFHK